MRKRIIVALGLGLSLLSGCASTDDSQARIEKQKLAFEHNLSLAKQGDIKRYDRVARSYMIGAGVKRNTIEAVKWYEKSAKLGNRLAQQSLATYYEQSKQYPEMLYWYEAISNGEGKDFSHIHEKLGKMHEQGLGTAINYKKAKSYYQKSIELSPISPAYLNLASLYFYGNGVTKNHNKTVQYIESYSDNYGLDSQSHYYLAVIAEQSGRDPQSQQKAFYHYKQSASSRTEYGSKSALKLANLYYYGQQGVVQNDSHALTYFEMAARYGNSKAQTQYAKMVLNGEGTPANINQAQDWFMKAAQQGNGEAQYYTALVLIKKNVNHHINNYKIAKMWSNIAFKNQYSTYDISLYLGKHLTKEQVKSTQGMAVRCIESNYQHCYQ